MRSRRRYGSAGGPTPPDTTETSTYDLLNPQITAAPNGAFHAVVNLGAIFGVYDLSVRFDRETLAPDWIFNGGPSDPTDDVDAAPAVNNSRVYIGARQDAGSDWYLHAVDPDGTFAWRIISRFSGARTIGGLAVTDDDTRVLYGTSAAELVLIDTSGPTQIDAQSAGADVDAVGYHPDNDVWLVACDAIDSVEVYARNAIGTLLDTLDVTTLTPPAAIRSAGAGVPRITPIRGTNDFLFHGGSSRTPNFALYRIGWDPASGFTQRWAFDSRTGVALPSASNKLQDHAIGPNGGVFALYRASGVHASWVSLDAENGTVRWDAADSVAAPNAAARSIAVDDAGGVWVVTQGGPGTVYRYT